MPFVETTQVGSAESLFKLMAVAGGVTYGQAFAFLQSGGSSVCMVVRQSPSREWEWVFKTETGSTSGGCEVYTYLLSRYLGLALRFPEPKRIHLPAGLIAPIIAASRAVDDDNARSIAAKLERTLQYAAAAGLSLKVVCKPYWSGLRQSPDLANPTRTLRLFEIARTGDARLHLVGDRAASVGNQADTRSYVKAEGRQVRSMLAQLLLLDLLTGQEDRFSGRNVLVATNQPDAQMDWCLVPLDNGAGLARVRSRTSEILREAGLSTRELLAASGPCIQDVTLERLRSLLVLGWYPSTTTVRMWDAAGLSSTERRTALQLLRQVHEEVLRSRRRATRAPVVSSRKWPLAGRVFRAIQQASGSALRNFGHRRRLSAAHQLAASREVERLAAEAGLPPLFLRELLFVEDRRFLWHPGVDVVGILRAALRNLVEGKVVHGGSTIPEQLVKLRTGVTERSVPARFYRAILALHLCRATTRPEVLREYLSLIYFGQRNHGLHGACAGYFGMPLDSIGEEEARFLVARIARPTRPAQDRSSLLLSREVRDKK